MKLVEPTKRCPHCKTRKSWSEFAARTKWPDGTMRCPQSWCRACQASRPQDAASRRRANAKYWEKFKQDASAYADHLERRRFRYHIERGTIAPIRRRAKGDVTLLPAAVFIAWLDSVAERDGVSRNETAARLGISDRVFRKPEGASVELETVERALIADGTLTLRDLYPSIYEEAA